MNTPTDEELKRLCDWAKATAYSFSVQGYPNDASTALAIGAAVESLQGERQYTASCRRVLIKEIDRLTAKCAALEKAWGRLASLLNEVVSKGDNGMNDGFVKDCRAAIAKEEGK